jgi:ribosomal protein L11 methylase PrmA
MHDGAESNVLAVAAGLVTIHISRYGLQERSVMDYGAGSGVLAVAALKLGADTAAATDVDQCAVSACRRNAQLNGVEGSVVALRCERDLEVGDAIPG